MLKRVLLFSFIAISISAYCQNSQQSLQDLRVDVVYLASDLLEGRETGKKGEALAAQYIATRFTEAGLEPMGESGTFLQSFSVSHNANPHGGGKPELRTARNVVGYLDNQAEYTVVIGAHYDHLGHGHFGSLHTGEPAIHNGADDNASGVAAMIWLAGELQKEKYNAHNYLFIGFSGEEMGLHGSRHYVNNPTIELSSVSYMLNMDMVGMLKEGALTVNGVGTSPAWKDGLNKSKTAGIKTINMTESGVGPSDHTSFYLKDIPSVHFFTGAHKYYHRPEDDSEIVNYDGIYEICKTMANLIEGFTDQGKLPFSKTKDEEKERMSFKVTLGVMPDYGYTGKGMRVEAVLDDRPAQEAGLEDGDVILKLADKELEDIYDYMKVLGEHKVGDEVPIVVLRGKKEVKSKVKF